MGQQSVTKEDAFPIFQKRCTDLFEANLLLEVRVHVLERELAAAQEENARLQQQAGAPVPSGGPDLAAQPPYLEEERG